MSGAGVEALAPIHALRRVAAGPEGLTPTPRGCDPQTCCQARLSRVRSAGPTSGPASRAAVCVDLTWIWTGPRSARSQSAPGRPEGLACIPQGCGWQLTGEPGIPPPASGGERRTARLPMRLLVRHRRTGGRDCHCDGGPGRRADQCAAPGLGSQRSHRGVAHGPGSKSRTSRGEPLEVSCRYPADLAPLRVLSGFPGRTFREVRRQMFTPRSLWSTRGFGNKFSSTDFPHARPQASPLKRSFVHSAVHKTGGQRNRRGAEHVADRNGCFGG
jgi:hypothetical protein